MLSLRLAISISVCLGGCTGLLNWLALRPWREAASAHWTERARLLFPVRNAAGSNLVCGPGCLVLGLYLVGVEDDSTLILAGATAWLSTVAAGWPLVREVFPWLTFRDWLYETLTQWLFWFAGWFVLVGAVAIAPQNFSAGWWLVFGVALVLQTWLIFGGSLWLGRRLGLVTDAPEGLKNLVMAESGKAGVRCRNVFVIQSSSANAFALVHTGEVGVTSRALDLLTNEELSAICAHEMGHLAEPSRVRLLRFLGSMTWVAWIGVRPLWPILGPAAPLTIAGCTYLARYFLVRLSRAMEVRADSMARSHEIQEGVFARALAHLAELNLSPVVLPRKLSTHPDVYDRLMAAGVTPDFARPPAPEEMSWHGYIPKCAFCVLAFLAVGKAVDRFGA